MAYNDIQEVPVKSSWIKSLIKADEDVLMTLRSGHRMIIRRLPEPIFEQWIGAKSKGQYFHQRIKPAFQIDAG